MTAIFISKRFVSLFIVCFCFNIGFAQQNLFNIPSGDITNEKKIFYQHQLNVYSNKLESKAHLVYGLGKGWDAGVNLVGKGFYFEPNWRLLHNDNPTKGSVYPVLMGTVQKQFHLSEHFDFNLGSQVGFNLSSKVQNKELNYYAYGIGVYHFMHNTSRIVGGVYKTNKMFVGQGNTLGGMLGYELKLSKKWYLMGDWVSGNNDGSVTVIGGMYNASKRLQICSGWQIPNPNTPKPTGLVLELNLMGWDLY
ncbi:MAG: hypothetical protein ACOVO1_08650 [Chitinophagaceae bacterium]